MSTIDIKPSPVMEFRQVSRDFLFLFLDIKCLDNKITFIFGSYPDDFTAKENRRKFHFDSQFTHKKPWMLKPSLREKIFVSLIGFSVLSLDIRL